MIANRSALSMRCQRAISGKVRPQPKQRLVRGSIMQTAMPASRCSSSDIEAVSMVRASTAITALFRTHDRLVARPALVIGHNAIERFGLQGRRFLGIGASADITRSAER